MSDLLTVEQIGRVVAVLDLNPAVLVTAQILSLEIAPG
jgi:hypothetical protein